MTTLDPAAPTAADAPASAARRRIGFWVALLGVLVLAGVVLSSVSRTPARPLDPASTSEEGSRALARVLAGYGTRLVPESTIADARADRPDVLVVLEPDVYSSAQLRTLSGTAARVVLLAPGTQALRAVSSIEPDSDGDVQPDPGCRLPGAVAAGVVDFPDRDGATVYVGGTTSCYGGAVVRDGGIVALGSVGVLQNAHLGDEGVAALDVNLLSADRTASTVVWLRAGPDAGGTGETTVWDLFPDAAYRAFVWLLLIGVLVVLWRARRLGPTVLEPLPVIVRATELVEGHGRLHRRAGARDRASGALRRATSLRLIARLGLPRDASPEQIGAMVAPIAEWTPAQVHTVLAGPIPSDDTALLRLAGDLDSLESAVRSGTSPTRPDGRNRTR